MVTVKLFGPAAQLVGVAEIAIQPMDTDMTCGWLKDAIVRRYPQLVTRMPSARLAVNYSYTSDDTLLTGDEEIALIEAVSGG